MKIYFACSIRGEQGGREEKKQIIESLKKLGHEVLSELFVDLDLQNNQLKHLTPEQIYLQDIGWVNNADMIVADVSRVSMGAGYEIGWMLAKGKRVLALCHKDKYESLSNMIKGCQEENFKLMIWEQPNEIEQILSKEL